MRGFAYVTATVLLVIGIGVGMLVAMNRAALPAGTGRVTGWICESGGPFPGTPRAAPRTTVTLSGTSGDVVTTVSGADGDYSMTAPPGTYRLVVVGGGRTVIVLKAGSTLSGEDFCFEIR